MDNKRDDIQTNSLLKNSFRLRGFGESLKIAIKGIIYLFLYHRNMRIIFILGVVAFILGICLKLKGIELVALCITITLVFVAEMFNTAIEMVMDIMTQKHNTLVKIIKDISAGVVLIASLNAIAIGYILFFRKIFKF